MFICSREAHVVHCVGQPFARAHCSTARRLLVQHCNRFGIPLEAILSRLVNSASTYCYDSYAGVAAWWRAPRRGGEVTNDLPIEDVRVPRSPTVPRDQVAQSFLVDRVLLPVLRGRGSSIASITASSSIPNSAGVCVETIRFPAKRNSYTAGRETPWCFA